MSIRLLRNSSALATPTMLFLIMPYNNSGCAPTNHSQCSPPLISRLLEPQKQLKEAKAIKSREVEIGKVLDAAILDSLIEDSKWLRLTGSSESDVVAVLNQNIASEMVVCAAIPRTELELSKVFDIMPETIGRRSLAQMERAETAWSELRGYTPVSGAMDLQRSIRLSKTGKRGDKRLVIIFAHNDGTHLRFPDGSRASGTEISSWAEMHQCRVLVLSCETIACKWDGVSVVTTRKLDFEATPAALASLQRARTRYRTFGDFVNALDLELQSGEVRSNLRKRVVVVTVSGTSVVFLATLCGSSTEGESVDASTSK